MAQRRSQQSSTPELSVRPSTYWTGLDSEADGLLIAELLLRHDHAPKQFVLSRPPFVLRLINFGTHWHSLSVRPSLDRTGLSSWLTLWGPAEPMRSVYPFSFVDPLNVQDTAEPLRYPHPVPAPFAV